VRRAIFFLAALTIGLSWPLVSGASLRPTVSGGAPASGKSGNSRRVTGHITLRARYGRGPWTTKLSLKLIKTRLWRFTVCGVWNWPDSNRFTCLGGGSPLPERTTLRLEQNPVAGALERDDSPGWGMLGASGNPVLKAILSNTVTNDNYGTFSYRVTLRDLAGKVLITSNKFALTWHR
jgi:hypothetical protein